jgi:hypothetical protein
MAAVETRTAAASVSSASALPSRALRVALGVYVRGYRMRLPGEHARAYIEESTREAAVEENQLQS